jgi:hypothetical protein
MVLNSEFPKMWKVPVMANFKALSQHFPGATGENNVKSQPGQPLSRLTFNLKNS